MASPPVNARLLLFGPPRLEQGGQWLALPNERRSQLLLWLTLRAGWVRRAEVAALLWPELESRLAQANLRKTLHRLPATPWAPLIDVQPQALQARVATDVADFEAALTAGHGAEALALYTGDLLAGFEDDANPAWAEWLHFERERLRTAWRAAALAQLASETDAGAALALAARLLAADPLDEAALQAQTTWLRRAGQPAAAQQAYQAYAERLQRELGVAPSAGLQPVHEARPSPPATPPSADPGFVGRSTELRRVADLLARPECQLLCLVGPGGVGKTRLARHALQALAPAGSGLFVALEDLVAAADVGPRLARELGLTLAASDEALARVTQHLAAHPMLLVLDNFEQLVGEAAWLDELVRACPRLKLIVTSRVRPELAAAWHMPLEGLPCPEPEDADRLEAFDAARLFVQAAQRVQPALVAAAEAEAIVDICRQVEGLPLALELAAAWTRVLPCTAIADELRRGTELLRATDPTRPARQASLQVVFEHSWLQLGTAEREALARLSLFRGGFTADAARAVAAAPLPVLAALVDRSLLRKDGARCFLHPLVQQFASQRLGRGVAHEAATQAHARHQLRRLAELRPGVRRGEREALRELDAEFENIRPAWLAAAARRQHAALARATPALLAYCDHRGRWTEGLALLGEALPQAAGTPAGPLLAAAASHLAYRLDRLPEAQAQARRALAAARGNTQAPARLQAMMVLGATALRLGQLAESRHHYRGVLKLGQAVGDAPAAAAALDNLALVERHAGRLDEALALSLQGLLRRREMGDAADEALVLNNLGVLHAQRGDLAAAREALLAARRLCEAHGLPTTRSLVESNLADVCIKTGDHAAGRAHARQALALSSAAGQRGVAGMAHLLLMQPALAQGELAAARAELAAAMEIAIATGRPALKAAGVYLFADLLAAQGDTAIAARVKALALQQPGVDGDDRERGLARMRKWGVPAGSEPAWPGPPLEELVHRIVTEAPLAHAPLLAQLRR